MARHSKWHKVKQFKGAIDAKRSASFTKLAREITVAVKEKGADPNMNARLRTAIDRARDASMPRDSIERAIKRGSGGTDEAQLETLTYEAYAPGGTALIIECLTDSRNRATNDVKHLVTKAGGSMANAGSVTYLFDHVGVIRTAGEISDEQELAIIDAGAADILKDEDGIEIRCPLNDLAKVTDTVAKLGFKIESSEFAWIPKSLVETDEATGLAVSELIDELEAHDDVSRVYSNLA
ncbi:MAG TPA: YebC/PmpR family DNA-binding transcriptional regulator [Verrucomicrobiae bacterium]|nr:YebC/PmpR family DNA-binding transcriptional regulator [Verrucomicrobiae bacterium]